MRRPAAALDAVRTAGWLNAQRGRTYMWMLAAMVSIQAVNLFTRIVRSAFADQHFRAEPTDFDTFWAASHLCLNGQAASVYIVHAMQAAEAIGAQPAPGQFFPYLNPPVFLLLCLPLALLPYLPAMAVFVAGGYALITTCLRRILPPQWPWVAILASPAIMLNATFGQNGWLSASCYAGAMLLLDRRPALAGAWLGLLAFKPHLALCVPVALLAARRWTALAACAATAAGLGLAAWAVLGSAVWIGFLHAGPAIRAVLDGADTWPRMLSAYAAVRILNGGVTLAYAVQGAISLGAIAGLARLAWKRPGGQAEMAGCCAAGLICTPYLLDYDLVCLLVPMAWLAGRGSTLGWRPWEKLLLAVLTLAPLEARNFNLHLGAPVIPLLLAALLCAVASRIGAAEAAATFGALSLQAVSP